MADRFFRLPYAYSASFVEAVHRVRTIGYSSRPLRTAGWAAGTEPDQARPSEPRQERDPWWPWVAGPVLFWILLGAAGVVPGLLAVLAAMLSGVGGFVVYRRRNAGRAGETADSPAPGGVQRLGARSDGGREIEMAIVGLRKGSIRGGSGLLHPVRSSDWLTPAGQPREYRT